MKPNRGNKPGIHQKKISNISRQNAPTSGTHLKFAKKQQNHNQLVRRLFWRKCWRSKRKTNHVCKYTVRFRMKILENQLRHNSAGSRMRCVHTWHLICCAGPILEDAVSGGTCNAKCDGHNHARTHTHTDTDTEPPTHPPTQIEACKHIWCQTTMRTMAAKTWQKCRQTNWCSVREIEPFFSIFLFVCRGRCAMRW